MATIAEAIRHATAEELLRFSHMLVDTYSIGIPVEGADTLADATAGEVLERLYEWAEAEMSEIE